MPPVHARRDARVGGVQTNLVVLQRRLIIFNQFDLFWSDKRNCVAHSLPSSRTSPPRRTTRRSNPIHRAAPAPVWFRTAQIQKDQTRPPCPPESRLLLLEIRTRSFAETHPGPSQTPSRPGANSHHPDARPR